MVRKYDFPAIQQKALRGPRVTSLMQHFENIADGTSLVPRRQVTAAPEFLRRGDEYVRYHNLLQSNLGTFNRHTFASIPYFLEETIRVGIALNYVAGSSKHARSGPLTFYGISAADGSHVRTLAEYSEGLIETLSDSPNQANQASFERLCNHDYSHFHKGPFVDITPEFLLSREYARSGFRNKFDVIWEDTAFQMYSNNRVDQIAYVRRVLKEDGLLITVEKMNHAFDAEYRRREALKDCLFKTSYFTRTDILKKQNTILRQMASGQVTLDEFCEAIKEHFKYVYMIWNSGNFYEIAASNSRSAIGPFLSHLDEPFVPRELACDTPMVRAL